jgi:hypothetical protein
MVSLEGAVGKVLYRVTRWQPTLLQVWFGERSGEPCSVLGELKPVTAKAARSAPSLPESGKAHLTPNAETAIKEQKQAQEQSHENVQYQVRKSAANSK